MSKTDRKCTYRRCQNGTVYGSANQPPWTCMRCNGTGRIPSVADCRTAEIAGKRRYRLILVLRAAAQARGVEDEAAWARDPSGDQRPGSAPQDARLDRAGPRGRRHRRPVGLPFLTPVALPTRNPVCYDEGMGQLDGYEGYEPDTAAIMRSGWPTSSLQNFVLAWSDYDTASRSLYLAVSTDWDDARAFYAKMLTEDIEYARYMAAEVLVYGGWTISRINYRKS